MTSGEDYGVDGKFCTQKLNIDIMNAIFYENGVDIFQVFNNTFLEKDLSEMLPPPFDKDRP
jgi:hypothetical protein